MNKLGRVAQIGFVCLSVCSSSLGLCEEPQGFSGQRSTWHGYDRFDFEVAGKPVLVVVPKKVAVGRPWVWHGEFFGHKPAPDVALLDRGFHVAYMSVPDMLGSPQAVAYWDSFYQEMTNKHGLARKVALVGLSRGGLYCYNWATVNPEKVACIYGDAPVCDFKSWPGGKGKGEGSPRDWGLVMKCYGFKDEAEALAYEKNPVDSLKPLAEAGVPLLHVYGDSDKVVPWEENTGVIAERYRQLGGSMMLIDKPGVGHHPHGLDDPSPIVDFIVEHATVSVAPEFAPVSAQLLRRRDGLGNVLEKLRTGQPVSIAYLGGSITAAAGWRVKTREWFARQYPAAQVTEIHAAIGGTGSVLGVYRLQHDALRHNPDLLFVEFAVNDGGAAPEMIWRAMEGIVRQTWSANPRTDICFVYTYRVGYETDLRQGFCPRAASAMEMLADHYGIPSINFALKIVELQQAGTLVFQSAENTNAGVVHFSRDGVHPLDEGHRIYADAVADAVKQMTPNSRPCDHHPKLARTFVEDHWQSAKMVPVRAEMFSPDWTRLEADSPLAKSFGGRMGQIWEASKPGSRLSFTFRGSTARLYDLLGPDGGQVVITVDGETRMEPIPRFDSYCTYHRIATLAVADGLDPSAVHTVIVELHPEQPDRSPVAFRLQNPDEELKSPKYQGTKIRVSQILVLGEIVE